MALFARRAGEFLGEFQRMEGHCHAVRPPTHQRQKIGKRFINLIVLPKLEERQKYVFLDLVAAVYDNLHLSATKLPKSLNIVIHNICLIWG